MAAYIHFDEAREAATAAIRQWLVEHKESTLLLIIDLFGGLLLVSFVPSDLVGIEEVLADKCGQWFKGHALDVSRLDEDTRRLYTEAASEARPDVDQPRLLVLERHRSRTAWFSKPTASIWNAPQDGPPVVVFYSFKGGLGRSTLLASFAIQRARHGDSVHVVDFDLDSPGIGRLLSADTEGLTARWGVVDFLTEFRDADVPFGDYSHRCDRVSGDGQIRVMPAGQLDEHYADKLGRVDLEESPSPSSALSVLLERARAEQPDWILIDARTGISEPAGQLLAGFAHLHVLLGNANEQSWLGLDRVLDRLGKERVQAGMPQADILLVQAMVPVGEPGRAAKEMFAGRAESTLEERYYASADEEDLDRFWSLNDKQSIDAPHVSWPVEYSSQLATFGDISEVAEMLCSGAYSDIGTQIMNRFASETDQ